MKEGNKLRHYKELLNESGEKRLLTYDELLFTVEWFTKREIIKFRDEYRCTMCMRSTHRDMTLEEIILEKQKRQKDYDLSLEEWNKSFGHLSDADLHKIENWYIAFSKPHNRVNDRSILFVTPHDPPVTFEVHHLAYVKAALPWEYPDDWLTTLCSDCHDAVHFGNRNTSPQKIKVYTSFSSKQEYSAPQCPRCNGLGRIEQYRHVQKGICFECWGYGKQWTR
jgi:hypothetical protein